MNTRIIVLVLVVVVLGGVGTFLAISLKNHTISLPGSTTTTPPATTSTTSSTSTTSNSTSSTTTVSSNSILTADTVSVTDSSKKRFTAAQASIATWSLWKPNAVFSGLFMTFDAKLQLDSANEVYVFDSPDDPNNHLTVSVAQSSGNMLRAIIPTADYQGTLTPIKTEFWKSNYADAVQFADKNGGATFMAANTITSVDVKLYRTAPKDFLYWVVTYHTADATKSLTVKMDASTKTLAVE